MKRRLTQIASSVVLTGSLLGIGASSALAQGRWNQQQRQQERREERQERQADRIERRMERMELQRIRQLDRQRQLRYQYRSGNRIVGYYDRFGRFQAYGYYDRFGNFWRYR